MSNAHATLKLLRKLHLYLGLFIAPALLFFAFTGALQTFSLHESKGASTYVPPKWIVTLAQIHKNQTAEVPQKKAPKPDGGPKADGPKQDAPKPASPPPAPRKSHLPEKIFFLLIATGLFTSTLTGIYMAYKYERNKLAVTLLWVAGIVVPLVLLPF